MTRIRNYILILISLFLILTIVSCDNQPIDSSIDTNSEIGDNSQIDDVGLKISYEAENLDIYPSYKLGEYFGNGFKKEITCGFEGFAQYEIMQDYEETAESTTYGADVDEALFEDHYILALRFLYSPDNLGLVGIKSFAKGEARIIANAVYSANGNLDENEYYYYYIAMPISELEDWNDEGEIEIRKNFIDYIGANCIELDYTYEDINGYTQLLTRSELESYISKNNIPIRMGAIGNTENYIIHISKGRFDYKPSIMKPTYENGEIKITLDYSISYHKSEKAYLSIIPLNNNLVSDINEVNKVTILLRKIQAGSLSIKEYQINKETEEFYNNIKLYTSFNGGVYYGLELTNFEKSSYTIIDNIKDLKEKTEFRISEADLENNIVIVLRLVGEKNNRVGFSNIVPTENGMKITLHVSPFYEQIQKGFDELVDKMEELDQPTNRVEYEYILAPKSLLNKIQKTGTLTVETDLTFNNYNGNAYDIIEGSEYELYSVSYDKGSGSDLKSGDTWRIKTNLQLLDFIDRYGLNLSNYDYISKNDEYIVIYLENYLRSNILQWSIVENGNNLKLCYLVKEMEEQNKDYEESYGNFIIIKKNATLKEVNASIEYTKLEYTSASVIPNDESIVTYDFYEMDLSSGNLPNWNFKLISSFGVLENVFYTYGKYEKEEKITASDIFVSTVFDNNYILALHLTEGHTGAIKNTFYNARMSGDNTLHLYAFQNSHSGNDVLCEMLYFIIIPKDEIKSEIKRVNIQNTNEITYNGPFEHISITSRNEQVTLDEKHLILNSEKELEAFFEGYEQYEMLQTIDFENNILLAIKMEYYEYYPGNFINFKTTPNGVASITFMIDTSYDFIIDEWSKYVVDFIVIPKSYLQYKIEYLYIRYEESANVNASDKIEHVQENLEEFK